MRALPRWTPLLVWVGLPLGLCAALIRQPAEQVVMGQYTTRLEGRTPNQRHNARLSLEALNGTVIAPGKTFSFNDRVGTWSRDTGYKRAPVSFNGQLILAWGGGVCQTSTTLYNAALLSGMEVVERHQHRHAPLYIAPGRDAAVAFHGIDLKFRNPNPFAVTIIAHMAHDRLSVAIRGLQRPDPAPTVVTDVTQLEIPGQISVHKGGYIGRIRNLGAPGFDVTTYLAKGDRRTLISRSTYPAMDRVVEYRSE